MRATLLVSVLVLFGCGESPPPSTAEPAAEPAPAPGAPAALPESIHVEMEVPGPVAGRWLIATVTPGALPWTITGCIGPGRAPCEETSRVELDETARTGLVGLLAEVRAIPRCEPDGIFPNERPYEWSMTGGPRTYTGTIPADVAGIPARVEGPCRADARLAWFVATHFEPTLALPTPTTTSGLPLPPVPES